MGLERYLFTLCIVLNGCLLLNCLPTDLKNCSKNKDGSEINCPNLYNPVYTIKLKYNKIDISCKENHGYGWKFNILPVLNTDGKDYFNMEYCPFNENEFHKVLDALGIHSLRILQIKESKPDTNITLKKTFFENLKNLSSLIITSSGIEGLEENVFEGMEYLTNIILESNHITQLNPEVFRYTPNVKRLSLSGNKIQVNASHFKHLPKLVNLSISGCGLSNLDENVFSSLSQLKLLEMSHNNINLTPDLFINLTNLEVINLSINNIVEVPPGLFRGNEQIKIIRMVYNRNIVRLPDELFANLSKLEELRLKDCSLEALPENLVQGCTNLRDLFLNNNKLTTIPEKSLHSLKNLRRLDLSENKLSTLGANTFSSLKNLQTLKLHKNSLEYLDENLFSSLENLAEISLNDNNLRFIYGKSFENNKMLVEVALSNNRVAFPEGWPFMLNNNLQRLDLSHNEINIFLDKYITENLTSLNLAYNNIAVFKLTDAINRSSFNLEIHLENNKIYKLDLDEFETFAETWNTLDSYHSNSKNLKVILDNNPIRCDCEAYNLVRYFRGEMGDKVNTLVELTSNNLRCSESNEKVKDKRLETLLCTVVQEDLCPKNCRCFRSPWSKALIIDCADKKITEAPKLNINYHNYTFFNHTEVHLERNKLTSFPNGSLGYDNVTKLYVSYNHISKISWIPDKIEILALDNNKLMNIDEQIINKLNMSQTLKKLAINNNPLACNCSLSTFVEQNLFKKMYSANITCIKEGDVITNLTKDELCPSPINLYLVIAIVFVTFFIVIAVVSAFYYKYELEIKVWLFTHKLLIWWITEEEIDKDKPYDAFISFSHMDEEFVTNKLLPKLECGPHPYKLCVHYRDWVPGDLIPKQIIKSVANSKRTVVVLTPNFLESVWGKTEFRTAHETSMKEGCARLIVILYGDIDLKNNDVFEELKPYLKTKRFIKWSDPGFWNQLRYALPHTNFVKDAKRNKFNNIMNNIDKLDLIATPTTPNNGSTPPIMADPLIFKNNPLNFNRANLIITPPAECGAIIV